jgi:hypothetical protein
MNNELMKQYAHIWRVFERLVDDFDDDAWLHTGRKTMVPARLSFHILKSTKYYMEDSSTMVFASGKSFENNPGDTPDADIPSRADIVACIGEFKEKTDAWLSAMNLQAKNEPFPWAGESKFSVALFLLRHTLFHIGELSTLLNESQNGDVEDHFVKAL